MLEHFKAHHLLVPVHPIIHLAKFNIAHAMIKELQAADMLAVVRVERVIFHLGEIWKEHTAGLDIWQGVCAGATDKGVHRAAVGFNSSECGGASGIGDCVWFVRAFAAIANGLFVGFFRVKHGQGDVFNAITKARQFFIKWMRWRERRLQQNANVALRE